MLSKLEEHDVNENNKVGFKSLDINQKPYSKGSTLSPSQLLKQRAIESWYLKITEIFFSDPDCIWILKNIIKLLYYPLYLKLLEISIQLLSSMHKS